MDLQLEAVASERDARVRLARIEALERAADAIVAIAELATTVQQQQGRDAPPGYAPALPVQQLRLKAALSSAAAFGGRSFGESQRLSVFDYPAVDAVTEAARVALGEIETALRAEAPES
jgi:hypothetical protein